jgi:hypothetical protein
MLVTEATAVLIARDIAAALGRLADTTVAAIRGRSLNVLQRMP